MKGAIRPDHIPVNKYTFLVAGLPPIVFTKVGGLEEELETVGLPDRTQASGGNTKPGTTTVMQPMHHVVEVAAMELWYKQSQDPVDPAYKKPATLVLKSGTGNIIKSYTILGVFPKKRKTPDLEMKNEGEMAELEWELCWDDILPI